MFRRLTGWLRGLALRRAVAAVCAVAIIVVGFAHTLHHFDGKAIQAGYEVSSVTGADGSADPEKLSAPQGDHCHGCSMIAVLGQVRILDVPTKSEDVLTVLLGLHPRLVTFETPPPIRSI